MNTKINRAFSMSISLLAMMCSSHAQSPLTSAFTNTVLAMPAKADANGLANPGNSTCSFPSTAHTDWTGGTFTKTSAAVAGLTNGRTGTTDFNFVNMSAKRLPEGTFLVFGDIDSDSSESFVLQAWDQSGNLIKLPWLSVPAYQWGPQTSPMPFFSFNSITGTYRFDGSFNQKTQKTIAIQTRLPIGKMRVVKGHENNAMSIAAPLRTPEKPPVCCKGENYVRNPGFAASVAQNSDFAVNYSTYPNISLGSGRYKISHGAQVSQLNPTWDIVDQATNSYYTGKFMIAGLTSSPKKLWQQKVNVPANKSMTFCARFKALGSSPVTVTLRNLTSNQALTKQVVPAGGAANWTELAINCDTWGGISAMDLSIEVSGNISDAIALDNLAVVLKSGPVPAALLNVNLQTVFNSNGTYGINANAPTLPNNQGYWYFWEVTNVTKNTVASSPVSWWQYNPFAPSASFNFPGYQGNSTTASVTGTVPGWFNAGDTYRIRYGVWSKCNWWTQSTWEVKFGLNKQGSAPVKPEIRVVESAKSTSPPKLVTTHLPVPTPAPRPSGTVRPRN